MRSNLSARLVTFGIAVWVQWLYLRLWFRLANYKRSQLALARRYGIEKATPKPYDDETRARIIRLADSTPEAKQFAWTSGTTREPKQIYYPARRAKRVQRTLVEQVLLAYNYAGLQRPSFYLLTSMAPDKSWSSMFIRRSFPAVLNRVLLSGSILFVPRAAELVGRFSQTSVHVALWLLSEPAFIVTANPSSLYIILEQVHNDWARIRGEVKSILAEKEIDALRERIPGPDAQRQAHIQRVLAYAAPPSVGGLLPELQVVYCWNGGYVQPFIDNLKQQFQVVNTLKQKSAALPIRILPMFSVSTETIPYLMYPRVSIEAGLPTYPGNVYEFIPMQGEEPGDELLKPWELRTGHEYVMVVSDAFGLVRYNTEDIFQCRGMKKNTPLLFFRGRTGLRYSFTGEKLTAEQLLDLYRTVRQRLGLEGAIFTCFPRLNTGGLPNYVFVYCTMDDADIPAGLSAQVLDEELMQINIEYETKRNSARLAPPELVSERYGELAERVRASNPRYRGSNPAQFKMLPLYKVMWEDLQLSSPILSETTNAS